MHWGCYYATALDIEVHPQRRLGVFITAVPIVKLFAWGEADSAGHVLRERDDGRRSRDKVQKKKRYSIFDFKVHK